jgi:phospholipase C
MRGMATAIRALPIAIVAFLPSGCNGNGGFSPVPPAARSFVDAHPGGSSGKIRHVVIIIQENRSFNNLFLGYPGARTTTHGYDTNGNKILLQPVSLATTWDLDHSSYAFFAACNGSGRYPGTGCKMNGFDNEYYGCGRWSQPKCPNANPPYSYVPQSETKPYFDIAKQYVLADEMFASNFDASSFISHQYIIAGQANTAVNYPYSAWGCSGGYGDMIDTLSLQRTIGSPILACFDDRTLGDELDDASLSWGYYAADLMGEGGIWSAYQAIKHIYKGRDWKRDVISPPTRFFDAVKNGDLRAVSWVTPTWENSDHGGNDSTTGPAWVASLVNAIGQSKYWNDTAIFIFWDDPGGWYDAQPPKMLDYDGLGFRIPLLIVSAYAKKGYVSHVHYEHGSILRFVENTFGLGQLAASDKRATSPEADAFDFNKPPRRFLVIPSDLGETYFLHQHRSHHIPDAQ